MKIVETNGLYHYEVTGEKEAEAAERLARELDFIDRWYIAQGRDLSLLDIQVARQDIERELGVEIKAVIG